VASLEAHVNQCTTDQSPLVSVQALLEWSLVVVDVPDWNPMIDLSSDPPVVDMTVLPQPASLAWSGRLQQSAPDADPCKIIVVHFLGEK
jgi:hypothetical protein